MNSEIIIDVMYRKQHGNKNQLLRNVEVETLPLNSVLFINVGMAYLDEDSKVKKEQLYRVWVGKELNFAEMKEYGLGRMKQAAKFSEDNPEVRFIVPANYFASQKKVGKPDWFPSLIGDWDIVADHDVVVPDRKSLRDYLKSLIKTQDKVFENREQGINVGHQK